MSWINRMFGLDAEQRSAPPSNSLEGLQLAGILDGSTMPSVSEERALGVSAYLRCLTLISDAVAGLPVQAFDANDDPIDGPAWLVDANAADDMPTLLAETIFGALGQGNAYIYVLRDSRGTVGELVSIQHARMQPEFVTTVELSQHRKALRFRIDGGPAILVPGRDVLHVHGPRRPGHVLGLSTLAYASEALGLATSTADYQRTLVENGAAPSVVLETDGPISPEGQKLIKETWADYHGGSGRGRIAIATEGAKLKAFSIKPVDAQILESRLYSVSDIARIFGVPSHLLNDTERTTSWGSGIDSLAGQFALFGLAPWAQRAGRALTQLARSENGPTRRVALSLDGLTRADILTRSKAYQLGIDAGWLLPGDARAAEGYAALPNAPIAA